MFAVPLSEPYRRRFAERFRAPKPIVCERIAVPDGASFYTLHVPICGTAPWMRIADAAGKLPLLLPNGLTPPDGLRVFEPRRLPLLCEALSAGELLKKSPQPARKIRLGVLDPDGALRGYASALLDAAGDLRIVTRRPECFAADARQAMALRGAALTASDDADLLLECTAVVCISTASLPPSVQASVIFCLEDVCAFPGAQVLSGFIMPERYASLCPSQTDPLLFASALFETCGVCAMAEGRFTCPNRLNNSTAEQ